MTDQEKIYDVAVIGAGPAGISCALQLKRYGIEPLFFEKQRIGGLLHNANLVENYPGFPEGLSGPELTDRFKAHLKAQNLALLYEEVCCVSLRDEVFNIQTGEADYKAGILVLASGTCHKKPDIEISAELAVKVFYEVRDLYEQDLQDKKVIIIGAGDAAFDYALNLAGNSGINEVSILNKSSRTRCIQLLKERAFSNNRITYIENTESQRIEGFLNKIKITCRNGSEFKTDYLLFAIGRQACLDFLSPELSENKEELQTSKKLFLTGDVKNEMFRQTAIAAGDGLRTAMEIYKFLNENQI